MHCDLDLWPFDPKVDRSYPWLMGSVPVKFHEDRRKGEAVMCMKQFYLTFALWPWPLDPKVDRAHPWLIGNVPVKFHENGCKGEVVMRMKQFYLTYALCYIDLWPFDPNVDGAHPWLMGSVPVKFHEDRCKGEAVMHMKPFYLTPCIVTLTFDLLTSRSTGPIHDSWGVCLWSFMRMGVKGKQLCAWNNFT